MDPDVLLIVREFLNHPIKVSSKSTIKQPIDHRFISDLRLPEVTHSQTPKVETQTTKRITKYGFLEMLESVHGENLCKNNPWFNREMAKERLRRSTDRYKDSRRVHFKANEITEFELPHCRRRDFDLTTPIEHIHAPYCKNSPLHSKSTQPFWFENIKHCY